MNYKHFIRHKGPLQFTLSVPLSVGRLATISPRKTLIDEDLSRLDRARKTVLDILSADPEEYAVVFNSGRG